MKYLVRYSNLWTIFMIMTMMIEYLVGHFKLWNMIVNLVGYGTLLTMIDYLVWHGNLWTMIEW